MTSIYPELPQAIPAQAAETVGRVPAFDADQSRFLLRDGAPVSYTHLTLPTILRV